MKTNISEIKAGLSNAMHNDQDHMLGNPPNKTVAISLISGRYLLFDIDYVSYLRREHRICGVTIGTLPQSPSQNVFLGLPIEIMPEEARLLVEKGVCVLVDDHRAHDQALRSAEAEAAARRADYLSRIEESVKSVEQVRAQEKEQARLKNMKKRSSISQALKPKDESKEPEAQGISKEQEGKQIETGSQIETANTELQDDALFSKHDIENGNITNTSKVLPQQSFFATPTSSTSLLQIPSSTNSATVISTSPSYPLYKYLNEKGYFMTPGLRFGCQYSVYPGDPLRYHSHFLAVGTEWDEEIDLMDIVGGGRLGTGVKKGYLFGGEDPGGKVKTFSVEWAVM